MMSHRSLAQSRMPNRLAGAVALALLVSSPAAFAGTLNGGSATVNPGDTPETWTLTNAATLDVNPGGQSLRIQASNSIVNLDGASVNGTTESLRATASAINVNTSTFATSSIVENASVLAANGGQFVSTNGSVAALGVQNSRASLSASTVTSTVGRALEINENLSLVAGSSPFVTATNGTFISGAGDAVSITGVGTFTLSDSTVIGTAMGTPGLFNGSGVGIFLGTANILSGSTVTGDYNGVVMALDTSGSAVSPGNTTTTLLVDGATVSGVAGAGILVYGDAFTPTVAQIELRNGATVTGGNGNLLEVIDQGAANVVIDASALTGNVQVDAAGTADLDLLNGASLTGDLVNVTSLDLFDTARVDGQLDSVGSATLVGSANITGTLTDVATLSLADTASVVGDVTGSTSVTLADGAQLQGLLTDVAALALSGTSIVTGAFSNVAAVTLADAARWDVTADSTVGTLDIGSGTLAFAAPSPGYKTVTVAGDFAVNGGTLIFNSPLGDDTSPSDKLVVGGNTSGSGNIVVNNIGGAGAQTVEGIQLISVAGTSDAAFALSGRAVGAAYEYFLYKGGVSTPGDGGWYLRSSYTGDPCDLDPTLPACTPVDPGPGPGPGPDPDPDPNPDPGPDPVDPVDPVPVLRPEPGAYLANQAIATRMFQQRAHDRGERAFDGERAGAWVRVSRDQVHGDVRGQIDARSQSNVLQIGSDLARWGTTSSGQIGVMLASGRADTQAVSNVTGYSTRGKVKGDAVGVYGTWVQRASESTGAYVDGWLQYARFDNDVQGEGLTKEKYDATTRAASLEAGYSWTLVNRERGAWFIQPQVQLTYTDYKGDTLQEANGTVVQDGRAGGLESRVGVRLFGHDNATGNRVQPFFAVNWLRGDHGNSLLFDGERISATLPTNRYEAQAGAQLKLGLKWSAWGDMRVQRGDGGYKEVAGQIGLRRAW